MSYGRVRCEPHVFVLFLTLRRRPCPSIAFVSQTAPSSTRQLALPNYRSACATTAVRPRVFCAPIRVLTRHADWFRNFTASQNGRASGFTADELDHFLVMYQRYLYLLVKYEHKMEWIGFAPTPAVDLS